MPFAPQLPVGASFAAAPLELRLFGPFEARLHGLPLPRLRSRKEYRLLALLALHHPRPLDRTWLAGTLWPDSTDAQARANLRKSLKALRRALGDEAHRLYSPAPATLALDVNEADVDRIAFDTLLTAGDTASLEQAVGLCRGPLLEGWDEEWALEARASREQAYLGALERLAQEAEERGETGETERHLRLLTAADPLRETAHRALMALLGESGRYAAAGEVYRELRALLHRELNAAPAPETAALHARLQREAREGTSEVRDQGGEGGARREAPLPVAPSLSHSLAPSLPSARLPQPLTRLIGREEEVAATCAVLTEARLVTLTGAGGVGKTRLAIAVAARVAARFRDGVGFVDLAPLADGALVTQSLAEVLGVAEAPGVSLGSALTASLAERELLLVLDNCEHLVETCAVLVERLLHACGGVRILVTSRQPLAVSGEVCRRVSSLSEQNAVQLFLERASAASQDFRLPAPSAALVERICRQLEGIPLAIELAAPWVRTLPLDDLARRLEDRFGFLVERRRTALPRHRTLRALLDWSYELLPEAEQLLLRRLAVFAGGWTLAAAEAVCGDGVVRGPLSVVGERTTPSALLTDNGQLATDTVLDLLASLVEQSLVVYEGGERAGRYRLLETVREYARERLQVTGEEAGVRGRHLHCFLALAEQAAPHTARFERPEVLDRLESEHDNLRAALTWAITQDHAEVALRLAGALTGFWHRRGYLGEALERLATVLALPGALPPTLLRMRVLHCAGGCARQLGELGRARAFFDESVAISRALGDRGNTAGALECLGWIANSQGAYAAAWAYCEEGLAIFRESEDATGIAWQLVALGGLACDRGDFATATRLQEESLALFQAHENEQGMAWAFAVLGWATQLRGDYRAARECFEQALTIFRALGDTNGIARSQCLLGMVALGQGEWAEARALWRESLTFHRNAGRPVTLIDALERLALLDAAEGATERAARLFGAARTQREAKGTVVPPADRAQRERAVAAARAALGEEAFASAWAEGGAMSLDQAMADALEDLS